MHASAPAGARSPWILRTVAAAALLASAAGSAQAVVALPVLSSFEFSGTCVGCLPANEALRGTLVLQDYLPGTPILAVNLVSFSYAGSNMVDAFRVVGWDDGSGAYVFNPDTLDTISGAIGAGGGAADFSLTYLDGIGFKTSSLGTWSACSPGTSGYYSGDCSPFVALPAGSDRGVGTWSAAAVPEPASWLMLALGTVGLMGLRSRRLAAQR